MTKEDKSESPEYSFLQTRTSELRQLTAKTKEVVSEGNYTYDDLLKIALTQTLSSEAVFACAFSYLQDSSSPEARRNRSPGEEDYYQILEKEIRKTIELLEKIKPGLSNLLIDPYIAFRKDVLLEFFSQHIEEIQLLDLADIRQRFIDQFPTKKYYRALVIHNQKKTYISNYAKAANPPLLYEQVLEFGKRVRKLNEVAFPDDAQKDLRYQLQASNRLILPFLSGFRDELQYHLWNADTNSMFISVSESPIVCWHAVCDNEKDPPLWKLFIPGTHVNIYEFKLNSFYVLPRTVVFGAYSTIEDKVKVGEIEAIRPITSEQFEGFVICNLPNGWNETAQVLSPVFEGDQAVQMEKPVQE